MSYSSTGTTSLVEVEKLAGPVIKPGEGYFTVKVFTAQVAFQGSIWQSTRRVIVASKAVANHPLLDREPYVALQASREVQKGASVKLGLSPVLISLTPATMDRVSLSLEFILDSENRLSQLTKLIDDEKFTSALSLAPGALAAAKTVSTLAKGVLDAFLPGDGKTPILQFSKDFVVTEGIAPGRYAILGSENKSNPLPKEPKLSLNGIELQHNGSPVTNLSYVVLEIRTSPARTAELAKDATWYKKLQAAKRVASDFSQDPFLDENKKKAAWTECSQLIREAHALIHDDPLYIEAEATKIINEAWDTVKSFIFPARTATLGAPPVLDSETRRLLAATSLGEISKRAESYRAEAEESRSLLTAAGVLRE